MEENKKEEAVKDYKKYFKIIAIILAVILLLVVGYFVFVYIQIQRGEYVKWDGKWYAKEGVVAMDIYSGNSPEDTLKLFIDALKVDNIDLAVRYFVVEQQEEAYNFLESRREVGYFGLFVTILENNKKYKTSNENQFIFTGGNGEVSVAVALDLIKINDKWKINRISGASGQELSDLLRDINDEKFLK